MTKEQHRIIDSMERQEGEHYGVVASNLTLIAGTKELIVDGSFAIYPGRKVALIGRNGSGKTTLFETIVSFWQTGCAPEGVEIAGSLKILPRTKIGYLPQNMQVDFIGTVEQYLDACATDVSRTFNRYNELTEKMSTQNPTDQEIQEYGDLLDMMNDLDIWDFPRRRMMILEGLGLSGEYLCRDMFQVSGGEATKVALAGILLSSPNLILLDEPTNNLDPHSFFFLEQWVRSSTSSLFVISHDREFLDHTIEEIIEIDEFTKHTNLFGGNYSFYAQKKQEMFEAQIRHYEEQQRKRKQLEEEAARLKSEARKFENISKDAFYRAKGASLAKRASVQLDRIERELMKIPEPIPPQKPQLTVFESEPVGEVILDAKGIAFAYNSQTILKEVSFVIRDGERVGIIGPNGSGKTTLLRILLNELEPKTGVVWKHKNVKIGYLPQTIILKNPKEDVIAFTQNSVALPYDEARTLLGKVLFTDPALLRVGNFSVGELKRISLVGLFAIHPNLLLLDEPTNHLDVYTIEMLEEALDQYRGGIVVVSHDRRFLEKIGLNRLMAVRGDGSVQLKPVESAFQVEESFREVFA